MPVNYTQTLSADMVITEIESLLDWRNHLLRQCFFSDTQARAADSHPPAALLLWCRRGAESGAIDRKVVERMTVAHEELSTAAQGLLDHCSGVVTPTLALYDGFGIRFDGFVTQIRRLHQDIADAGMAVDAVTGLRTVSGMRGDLKREQDRFDRKGTSFSIADVEIDKLEELGQKYDRRTLETIFAAVAHMIARTIRSFDDAYFLGKGEYLVILKHVDFMDACAVMDRLRGEIDAATITLPDGGKARITASLGIAEALQRESADVALGNAKTALQAAKNGGGNRVHEYRETSILEQYAKDVTKGIV